MNTESRTVEGTWVLLSIEQDGNVTAQGQMHVTFMDGELTQEQGLPHDAHLRYSTDSSKSPMHIDYHLHYRGFKYIQKGIYRIDKDILAVCLCSLPGGPRPSSFKTTPKDNVVLSRYQRCNSKGGEVDR